jgi:transcriptional regulator with XRE-family HTH domain
MGLFPVDEPAYAATYAEEAAMVDAAELIASALDEAQISQSDLARRLGISRSEITARLVGERNITVRKLAATLHALDMDLVISATKRKRRTVTAKPSTRWAPPQRVHSSESEATRNAHSGWALTGSHR